MKILFCSLYLPSGKDGVSNSSRQLVSALEKKGVDITIYTTDWGWSDAEKIKQQNNKLRVFKALFNNSFDCSLGMLNYFRKTVNDFDLIHFNSIYSFSTVQGAYISRTRNIPYIICPQGNFIPSDEDPKVTKSVFKKKLFFRLLSRNALIKADMVVCNSEIEMEAVSNQVRSDNITYINNGLNSLPYLQDIDGKIIGKKLAINHDKSIFLFLGRLAEEKAIPFLLDVWEHVTKKMSDVVLIIAGSSEHGSYKKIKKQIEQLTCPQSVLLPGAVTGDLKIALLQKSKCMLLPSYFESFGNVVLESLASGTPVIASIGTPWKTLEENHFGKWLPWDVNIWAEAMINISRDNTYQNENFLRRSRQWVIDNFNWDNIADQYINLYKEVINQHR